MGQQAKAKVSVTSGLLSQSEREFLRGNNEVDKPDAYRNNVRHRARKRIEQIEEDLRILEASDNEDIAEEFRTRFNELGELRREIEDLKSQMDDS